MCGVGVWVGWGFVGPLVLVVLLLGFVLPSGLVFVGVGGMGVWCVYGELAFGVVVVVGVVWLEVNVRWGLVCVGWKKLVVGGWSGVRVWVGGWVMGVWVGMFGMVVGWNLGGVLCCVRLWVGVVEGGGMKC